jgi:hypothetical protein
MIFSFVLGIMAAVLLGPLFRYSQTEAQTAVNLQPCGSNSTAALSFGCVFDPMSFSWLPPPCYDAELTSEFLQLKRWEWYFDVNNTAPAPLEEVLRGDHPKLYVSWEYHLYHCTYMWRKMHRALLAERPLDGYIGSYEHTGHCEGRLLEQGVPLNRTGSFLMEKFPACGSVSLKLPETERST